jgi:signal transduction histidine kinase
VTAFTNLVANAVYHGTGSIRLEARQRPHHLELLVSDQGEGFAPPMLTRGVERFVRGRDSQGAGLGLSVVAAIARAHDGTAGMLNVEHGAEAWISLPLDDQTQPDPFYEDRNVV